MTREREARRSFLTAAGGVSLGAASVAWGAAPAEAATTRQIAAAGYPYWVGPAGSGAPFVIDPAVGAQKAINDALAAAGRSAVFVAGGTHPVKGPVILGDMQSLVGSGPVSTLLRAAADYDVAAGAMVRTPPAPFAGSRMSIQDIGLEGAKTAPGGVDLQIYAKPTAYAPDAAPWITRVFVSNTTGDGIHVGGSGYQGNMREYKITDCRVERTGGWAYRLASSDGFVSGCSAADSKAGGYLVAGGNTKVWGSKVYGSGSGATPGPGFLVQSGRCTLVGCEAQDTRGNGYEIHGIQNTLSGCTADSTGIGEAGTERYSNGFYIAARANRVEGSAFQRGGGGGSWVEGAKGMMHGAGFASGVDYLSVDLVTTDVKLADKGPWVSPTWGSAGTHSTVRIVG